MDGLTEILKGVVSPEKVRRPALDEGFILTSSGAAPLPATAQPRLPPEKIARLDWHNDLSGLILDINDAAAGLADERARDTLIRRLRRALEDEND